MAEGPDWTAITQACAAVAQAVAATLALVASYRLAKSSQEDASRREQAALERLQEERLAIRRVSIEHWAMSMKRAGGIATDLMKVCETASSSASYFRSARANLDVLLDLMGRRDLAVLDSYEALKHVAAGMAAIRGLIGHLDELLQVHSYNPGWNTLFKLAAKGIPSQMDEIAQNIERLNQS